MDKTFLLNNILKSDGTNQSQRTLPALVPDFIRIDERSVGEILNFTYQLAKQINFYAADGTVTGDWQDFFDMTAFGIDLDGDNILTILGTRTDLPPHFALFIAFVQLFGQAQNDINAITGKHLDFYYEDVLQLPKKAPVPDKVNLILELAKNLPPHLVPAGTAFKGPKESTGLTPIYAADNDIVVNKATVGSVRSVFIDADNNFTIFAANAANSADGNGKPFVVPGSSWSAFGESQDGKPTNAQTMAAATVGFAFASPMLILGEGQRTITLSLDFEDTGADELSTGDLSGGIVPYLSGAKAWIQPSNYSAKIAKDPANPSFFQLVLTMSLASIDPAVVNFSSALPGPAFDTEWPVMRVVLGNGAVQYNNLFNLRIRTAQIDVTVKGVKNVVVQNDQSQLSAAKAFQPFGAQPTLGSAFYVGSAEVFQKKLTSLGVDITWNEVPASNLGNYYVSYFDVATSLANIIFTANISLLYEDQWVPFTNAANPGTGDFWLFNVADAKALNEIDITPAEFSAAVAGLQYSRDVDLQTLTTLDNTTHDGFIRMEITGPDPSVDPSFPFKAFGQSDFPNIYAKRAIKIATDSTFTGSLPNQPYTPAIKTISLDYTSSQVVDLTDADSVDQFFHVEPFGTAKLGPDELYLLPQFRDESLLPQAKADSLLYLGNFYIGLSDLTAPQNISLLFQAAEGSANDLVAVSDEDIQWYYLAANQWVPITSLQILFNTTKGFQTSGIITFNIGADANTDNTLMPSGFTWIRGSISKDPSSISRLTDLKTQALEASYVLPGTDDDSLAAANVHLGSPLPALSVKDMVVKDGAIKTIQQPYVSFGGNPGEQAAIYYTRVSERLRHKKRALTVWDYERMILDAFPSIFKVKCLTHTDEDSDLVPGAVRAVVVPDLINKNASNPLEPKANLVTLGDIRDYVRNYIPPFVDFDVDSPVYEQLLADFKVGFLPGKDPGYYGNQLNEDIKRFLSPWAYEEGQDITFGGKVYRSDIIFFIENRDYVDFVNDFKLYHIFDGVDLEGKGIGEMAIGIDFIISDFIPPGLDDMTIGLDFVVGSSTEVAIASGPRSILVSAPNHNITVLKTGQYACSGLDYTGIGFMAIGTDFVVA
jgi:hypothetical protein